MNRFIKSKTEAVGKIKKMPKNPEYLEYHLYNDLKSVVHEGDIILKGAPVAEGKWQVIHAGLAGKVDLVSEKLIKITCNQSDNDISPEDNISLLQNNPIDFAVKNGFIGMGGGWIPCCN